MPIQRVVDVVSGYFTPAVMIMAIAGFVVWYVFGPPPALVYSNANRLRGWKPRKEALS